MNPGDFDQRIVIQSFVPAESSVVAVVDTFEQRVTNDFGELVSESCVVDAIQDDLGGIAQDYFGQRRVDFTTLAAVWAKVEEKSGVEGEMSYQLIAERRVQFLIRWRSDINEQMRILYRGRIYEIESIISDDARKHTMKIHTKLSDNGA
jgi:SPP1 family predicted phage head-tail adaptor